MDLRKTIYYEHELTDDFAENGIKTKKIPEGFVYIHRGIPWRVASALLYYHIARPLVFLFTKIVYLQRFRNRKCMKEVRKKGAYVYANHTNMLLDVYSPYIIRHQRRNYIIAGPDAFSIPGISWLVQMLGGVPVGETPKQNRDMTECAKERVAKGNLLTIFPEAHIWPYYTGIRPFRAASFHYPAEDGQAVYAMTHCYKKRRIGNYVRVDTYLDGPFYADMSLPLPERRMKLRNECLEAMTRRARENSTYEYWHYEKKNAA